MFVKFIKSKVHKVENTIFLIVETFNFLTLETFNFSPKEG
jgi:hypothetical protein